MLLTALKDLQTRVVLTFGDELTAFSLVAGWEWG